MSSHASQGGSCSLFTLGPPSAAECLREGIAWGADDGVLITDPAFAGSDTLATSKVLARAIEHMGKFDLILTGKNSVDADTAQVPPQLAELLGLPFLCGVRDIALRQRRLTAVCELDDGRQWSETDLPAVVSCAERLCEPAKVPADQLRSVSSDKIIVLGSSDLGPGPWGLDASRTVVGEVRRITAERRRNILSGSLESQVARAVSMLVEAGAVPFRSILGSTQLSKLAPVPDEWQRRGARVAVLVEPEKSHVTRELLGCAAHLGSKVSASVCALSVGHDLSPIEMSGWGADEVVRLRGATSEEDIARSVAIWCNAAKPWAVLAPSTSWGREVAARIAIQIDAGLTGDAVDLEVSDGRLVAWKPAFGGTAVAAIRATTWTQMATVRPGVLPSRPARTSMSVPVHDLEGVDSGRVTHLRTVRDDDCGRLSSSSTVIGLGAGVDPAHYKEIDPLVEVLGAELGATRKVTDKHWLPRSRQIGITGHSISPVLYVAIGLSGKFNHMIGVRAAGMVLAINCDHDAPIFRESDIGIVGDWRVVVPMLIRECNRETSIARSEPLQATFEL